MRNLIPRVVRLVVSRPAWLFAPQWVLAAPLVVLADERQVVSFYLLALPWLLPLVLVLNLPLAVNLVLALRLDEARRRNHALEHATILVLASRGLGRGVSGWADRHGFRIAGVMRPRLIRSAFEEVRWRLREGRLPHVSVHCGSNRVTVLGLGFVGLALVVVVSVVVTPPLVVRWLLLVGVLGAFVALQDTVGNWAQRRYFTSAAFADATILSIDRVRRRLDETRPVHFVRTAVSPPEDIPRAS